MDTISLERLNTLHPKLRSMAIAAFAQVEAALTGNAKCRVASALRTFKEQDALYAQGRTKPGSIVTNAIAGKSNHNYGLSFDIALIVDKDKNGTFESTSWDTKTDFDKDKQSDWMEVVAVMKRNGWEWGGDWRTFKDMPHFQYTFGLTMAQCYRKYLLKDFIKGTTYINI